MSHISFDRWSKKQESTPPSTSDESPDRYGFLHVKTTGSSTNAHRSTKQSSKSTVSQENNRLRTEKGRIKKWNKMLNSANIEKYRSTRKIITRARKGIPDTLRAQAWFILAGADKLLQAQPDLYDQLQHHGDSKWEGQILLDVDRTYPNHIKFREVGGEGQRTLFRILRAYSIHDSEVGYCQGIGFLAAFLMVYMSEIKVFWMLCAIMRGERFNLCHMYTDGMKKAILIMSTMDQLLILKDPALATHLEGMMIQSPMYMTGWIMTLFTSTFSFDFVVRIWDAFLTEGDAKILYRIALALLKEISSSLLKMEMEHTLKTLQGLPSSLIMLLSPDELMLKAESIRITTSQVKKIEKKIDESNAKKT